jgi:hypothetical protein
MLKPAKDDDALILRQTADLGKHRILQVGLWPTLYGFRVRAGWYRAMTFQVDWCCGPDPRTIAFGYKLALAILRCP